MTLRLRMDSKASCVDRAFSGLQFYGAAWRQERSRARNSLASLAAKPYITRHLTTYTGSSSGARSPFVLHVESARSGGAMSKLTRVLVAALFTWLAAETCWAQDGVITGRITDSSGAVLPGVNLSLTGTSIMGVRTAVSDEQGGYR